MKIQPFHLTIPVDNLETCRAFYKEIIGCKEGRSSDHWVDFDFFGHQLVIHYQEKKQLKTEASNPVDGKHVPVPHFGVVLTMEQFNDFSAALIKRKVKFIIEPYTRFKGETGEQSTMFFKDPSGNALEFKAFKNIDQLFAS
ncbi:VOC family protein [Patiriisocius marinus]|uniref:VOC family protein n=1 Tax=Patiriisocius marinus TaxID=1397112 RepID=UPI00232F6132|nr:VOC family protein [Patiriisocius marinus]